MIKTLASRLLLSLCLLCSAHVVSAANPVNINTASAAELQANLSGIGVKKADAIIRYREQNGPFASVMELTAVSGIGEKTIAKNRDLLRLESMQAAPAATVAPAATQATTAQASSAAAVANTVDTVSAAQ